MLLWEYALNMLKVHAQWVFSQKSIYKKFHQSCLYAVEMLTERAHLEFSYENKQKKIHKFVGMSFECLENILNEYA